MNLGELKQMVRASVPNAVSSKVGNEVLEIVINQSAIVIAGVTMCLPKNTTFNIVAETADYNLSTIASDYLGIDKSGVHWYDSTQWMKLYPRNLKFMDENHSRWRDDDSADPKRFFLRGNILTLHPKPDTSGTDYGWLYYYAKGSKMTLNTHYPFHITDTQTTAIPHLVVLSDTIIKYGIVYLYRMLRNELKIGEDTIVLAENEYKKDLVEKRGLIQKNLAMFYDSENKMRGERKSVR